MIQLLPSNTLAPSIFRLLMNMDRNIGEQLLDLSRKIIKDIVVHISKTNLISKENMPRRSSANPEQNSLEEKQKPCLLFIRSCLTPLPYIKFVEAQVQEHLRIIRMFSFTVIMLHSRTGGLAEGHKISIHMRNFRLRQIIEKYK